MAEQIGEIADKVGQNDTTRYHLAHPIGHAEDVLIAGASDESGVQRHSSINKSTEHTTFQCYKGSNNAMQRDVTEPKRADSTVDVKDKDDTIPSSAQKPTTSRFNAVIQGVTRKGHKKVYSESGLFATDARSSKQGSTLRRTHSAVLRSPLDLEKKQKTSQEKGIESVQPRDKRIEERVLSPVVDQTRLDHQLRIALIREASTDRNFVPIGNLDELITQESVKRELSRIVYYPTKVLRHTWRSAIDIGIDLSLQNQGTQRGQTRVMYGGATTQHDRACYKRIFAILLFMGRSSKIWSFVREHVSDADLPLQDDNFELRRRGKGQPALKCLKKPSDISQFGIYQWWVLAPFFCEPGGAVNSHFKVPKKQILPFISWDNMGRQGGSGEVYKAKVHPDHHAFDKSEVPDDVVAVKKLYISNRDAFDRELNVLQNLRKKRHAHNHLITLLAAYEQCDHLCLMLPWAEADLNQYWRLKTPEPLGSDAALSTWLKQQCCGIAEAVSQIHRYQTLSGTSMLYNITSSAAKAKAAQSHPHSTQSHEQRKPKTLFGRHGDIKPANILWFSDGPSVKGFGTLKLSDFGTAHFIDNNRISVQERDIVPYSRSYRSPECQLPGGEPSSQCDVWALGCVFLEFVCWYFGGSDVLEDFRLHRSYGYESASFFLIRREDSLQSYSAELKPPVKKMIKRLREQSASKPDLLGILNAIQNDMLLIVDEAANSGHRLDDTDISVSSNSLGVTQQVRRRRKSSGNIARALSPILPSSQE